MRTLRSATTALLVTMTLTAGIGLGCGSDSGTGPETAAAETIDLSVGAHRIQLVPPADWDHLNHGREHRFERPGMHISISDMGPATPEALSRIVNEARALHDNGRTEDSKRILETLSLQPAIVDAKRRKAYTAAWRLLMKLDTRNPPTDLRAVDDAFVLVASEVRRRPRRDPAEMAMDLLPHLDHNERRNIADEGALTVDGCAGYWVDTWDRLNHTGRMRHLIVLNDGHLLAVRMEMGPFEAMEAAFDAIAASIRFPVDG